MLIKGAVGTVAGTAAVGGRGEALAGLFLTGYVGLAVPVLGLGIATRYASTENSLLGFVLFEVAVVAAVARPLLSRD